MWKTRYFINNILVANYDHSDTSCGITSLFSGLPNPNNQTHRYTHYNIVYYWHYFSGIVINKYGPYVFTKVGQLAAIDLLISDNLPF